MDTLRGNFGSADYGDDDRDYDIGEEETGGELPPVAIGTDERRMQVRAYNHWASLLDERNFPSIEELEPENLTDFGPYSVLLDFTSGIENPGIHYLGAELAGECGTDGEISQLSDVPSRSLLSRITDHYMQILANQAPIGFEAEFVNQRGSTILYRGILLPYSSDGDTIDFIYGVINWKEMADQITTDELLLEIDQVLEGEEPAEDDRIGDDVTDWADAPAGGDAGLEDQTAGGFDVTSELEVPSALETDDGAFPVPRFGGSPGAAEEDPQDSAQSAMSRMSSLIQPREQNTRISFDDFASNDWEDDEDAGDPLAAFRNDSEAVGVESADNEPHVEPAEASPLLMKKTKSLGHGLGSMFERDDSEELGADDDEDGDEEPLLQHEFEHGLSPAAHDAETLTPCDDLAADPDSALYDCLAEARELALLALSSEDRTRSALYDAVGRAYDVSLAAEDAPEEFEELIAENGLSVQERAPMTPVVKLVFGADYDKTRLTEYAAVLHHARRIGIARGGLSRFLGEAAGGLKGVVQAERRLRKEESGQEVAPVDAVRPAIAKKLRALEGCNFDALDPDGAEFGVVLIRRDKSGGIVILGETSDDIALTEKVARKLLG